MEDTNIVINGIRHQIRKQEYIDYPTVVKLARFKRRFGYTISYRSSRIRGFLVPGGIVPLDEGTVFEVDVDENIL